VSNKKRDALGREDKKKTLGGREIGFRGGGGGADEGS